MLFYDIVSACNELSLCRRTNVLLDDEQKLSLALGFNNSEKAMEHVFFDNRKTQHLEVVKRFFKSLQTPSSKLQ